MPSNVTMQYAEVVIPLFCAQAWKVQIAHTLPPVQMEWCNIMQRATFIGHIIEEPVLNALTLDSFNDIFYEKLHDNAWSIPDVCVNRITFKAHSGPTFIEQKALKLTISQKDLQVLCTTAARVVPMIALPMVEWIEYMKTIVGNVEHSRLSVRRAPATAVHARAYCVKLTRRATRLFCVCVCACSLSPPLSSFVTATGCAPPP